MFFQDNLVTPDSFFDFFGFPLTLGALARRTKPIRIERGPGRNDPCPCGSGHKHKYCCGSSERLRHREECVSDPEVILWSIAANDGAY